MSTQSDEVVGQHCTVNTVQGLKWVVVGRDADEYELQPLFDQSNDALMKNAIAIRLDIEGGGQYVFERSEFRMEGE